MLIDCSLKFIKDGKFCKFGFIGFKFEEEVQKVQKYFNKSFIDIFWIIVEFCKLFGDLVKFRVWSKYVQKLSQFKQFLKDFIILEIKKDEKKKKVVG